MSAPPTGTRAGPRAAAGAGGRSRLPASPTAPARTGSPARDPAAVARAAAAPRRSAAPRPRRARARASGLAVLLRGGLGGGHRRLVGQPRLHRARALARPVAQRRVRAAIGHGLVRRQRGLPFLLLLARQAESGERAELDAALHLGHRADRLEGLRGGTEALLLELGLADEEPGLGLHRVVIAVRGLRRVGDRGFPALLLERGRGEVE